MPQKAIMHLTFRVVKGPQGVINNQKEKPGLSNASVLPVGVKGNGHKQASKVDFDTLGYLRAGWNETIRCTCT